MGKWAIILLFVLVTFSIVLSLPDSCEQKLDIGKNCTMLSPTLSCGNYTYSILNKTEQIGSGNLTELNQSIYYFIFNQSKGDYIVQLCDGSTREITVGSNENMIVGIMIFFSMLILVLGLAAYNFDNELRFFFALLMFLMIVVGLNLSANMSIGLNDGIVNVLWSVYRVSLYIFMMLVFIVLIKMLTRIVQIRKEKRKNEF